ncbi:peptide-methionine (S)-S-oxide reductase MsrA [Planctomycetota bacterium]|nr:peptide-methionine (S)-S-oxide reductase MsrA [Planctomycetota bacterium]
MAASFKPKKVVENNNPSTKSAILAGGCFWCTEGVFEHLDGVISVESGYTGGDADTANYQAVTTGRTKHAEAIKVVYNPNVVTYGQLLKIFFTVAHDPTTLNRQGNDIGPQYRSAIFYETPQQKQIAEQYIKQLESEGTFNNKIVTIIEPLETFYPAEAYHQDYAANNPYQAYIRFQALPKIDKLKKAFPDQYKSK